MQNTIPTPSERSAALLAYLELPTDTPTQFDGGISVDGFWSWVISVNEMPPELAAVMPEAIADAFPHGNRLWVIFPY